MTGTAGARRPSGDASVFALRANCLAALTMLVVESSLGVAVSVAVRWPLSGVARGLPAQLPALFTRGPLPLALHATLGVLLLASATAALVRAVALRQLRTVGPATLGSLATGAAAAFGAGTLGGAGNASSIAMASCGGLAMLAYALLLFLLPAAGREPIRAS